MIQIQLDGRKSHLVDLGIDGGMNGAGHDFWQVLHLPQDLKAAVCPAVQRLAIWIESL
jgi:hypothetical protein